MVVVGVLLASCRSGFDQPADAVDASTSDSDADQGLCGNGVLDEGEQCDDGNDVDEDSCTSRCALARCGDGVVRAVVEQCDDGNTSFTDGCTNSCITAPEATEVVCLDNDRCYGLYPTPLPWASIDSACMSLGGTRAWFDTSSENDFVAGALELSEPTWLGLHWLETVNRWDWGPPEFGSDFFRWAATYPMSEESGRAVLVSPDGSWMDAPELEAHPYLCVFEPRWIVDADNAHAYSALFDSGSWAVGRLACRDLGFDLATITSAEEQLLGFVAADESKAWIGLDLADPSGTWVTGEPLEYTNWDVNEPEAGLNCVSINKTGTWDSESCSSGRRPICEAQ